MASVSKPFYTLVSRYSISPLHGKLDLLQACSSATNRGYSQEANAETIPEEKMSFEDYRKIRKALKWRGRVAGVPLGLLAITASSAVNIHFNPDMFNPQPEVEIQPILGMDPVIFAVLCGAGSGILGFALGGVVFNATWKLMFSKTAKLVQEREDDFLSRLHKHRYSRFDQSKYEDDYYAEKVMSLSDYRQWVREQQIKKKLEEDLRQSSATAGEEGK